MKDILDEIIATTRSTVADQKKAISQEVIEESIPVERESLSMKKSLAESPYGILAEFKRRSPSKGWIKEEGDVIQITTAYERNGASALSILTDTPYFGGGLKDIRTARPKVNLPILRKDFIIDEYQLYQAKVVGSNAILLIAAALTKEECYHLARKAHSLQLEVLLEVHHENELDHINEFTDMVGVNNRNLGTFHTDIQNSFRLASLLPKDTLLVSESGISSPETILQLREAGFRGFLIGENFMKTEDPGKALGEFLRQYENLTNESN